MDPNVLTTVVFEISQQCFAMPTDIIHEFVDTGGLRISVVPGCEPPCSGIIQHRNKVIPVIDMRLVFGFPSFAQHLESLDEMLKARERDHVAWLEELQHCCKTGQTFTKATDPHKCAFGKWYDHLMASEKALVALTDHDAGLDKVVREFNEPHQRIHGIAGVALAASAGGDLDEANRIIEKAWDQELGKMKTLFTELLKRIVERRKSRLIIGEVEGEAVALLVDKIRAIQDIASNDIQPMEVTEGRGGMIKGVFSCEQYGELCVMDTAGLEHLLKAAPETIDETLLAA